MMNSYTQLHHPATDERCTISFPYAKSFQLIYRQAQCYLEGGDVNGVRRCGIHRDQTVHHSGCPSGIDHPHAALSDNYSAKVWKYSPGFQIQGLFMLKPFQEIIIFLNNIRKFWTCVYTYKSQIQPQVIFYEKHSEELRR